MRLRDFDESTLWGISSFERLRAQTSFSSGSGGFSGFAQGNGRTVLPSSLCSAMAQLQRQGRALDVTEVIAACVRHRESALILLRLRGWVWPLTLFPQRNLHHLPQPIIESLSKDSRDLQVISVEPAAMTQPMLATECADTGPGYRNNQPLLWAMAMHAPFGGLLAEIGGRAAYRVTADTEDEGLSGVAVKASLSRLRTQIASLEDVAKWPGMGTERAARLLNGAYLQGGLRVLRNHPSARHTPRAETRSTGMTQGR